MVSPTRKTVLVLAVLVLLIVALSALASRRREPRYQGKPLHLWLAQLDPLGPTPPGQAGAAVQAVRAMGTNSFPCLASMLRAKESPWNNLLLAINASQKIVHVPVASAGVSRVQAIDAYTVLGEAASNAVPSLVGMLESERSPEIRACVATALGRIGPAARSAIPALLKAAQDQNAEVSKCALFAILNIRMWSPEQGIRELRY